MCPGTCPKTVGCGAIGSGALRRQMTPELATAVRHPEQAVVEEFTILPSRGRELNGAADISAVGCQWYLVAGISNCLANASTTCATCPVISRPDTCAWRLDDLNDWEGFRRGGRALGDNCRPHNLAIGSEHTQLGSGVDRAIQPAWQAYRRKRSIGPRPIERVPRTKEGWHLEAALWTFHNIGVAGCPADLYPDRVQCGANCQIVDILKVGQRAEF